MTFQKVLFLCVLFFVHISLAMPSDYSYLFPKPNAEHVSVFSRLIVRFQKISPTDISNLNSFIIVKSKGRRIPGQTTVEDDNRTITFQPDAPFEPGALVSVSLKPMTVSTKLKARSFDFRIATDESDGPWLNDENVTLQKSESEIIQKSFPRIMSNGVSVPSDFPHINVGTHKGTADGYLFVHNIRDVAPYNIIFDNNGSPVWYERWGTGELRRDFTVQPNGMITMTSIRNGRKYVGYDENFNLIDEFEPADGYVHDGHELQVLENGHYLIIGRRNVKIDASKFVQGGQTLATVEETTVQEFTADHRLILNWPALDNLIDGLPNLEIDDPTKTFFRFPHFNAIDVDKADGNLLISSRMLSEVTKIDREFGDIIWRLGGANSDFRFVNDPFNGFSCQHDIRSLGNGLYSVFDNGTGRVPQQSRGVVYKLDLDNMTATLVWQYMLPEAGYSYYMGNMQHLPNGNYLINWAVGSLPKVTEVTPSGELVYEMNFQGNYDTYRSFRHPWTGVVAKPRLFVEQDDASTVLIFNKFGDKNVDYYKIYGGLEANPTTVIDTSRATLKRFSDLIDKRRYYFRVTAVDHNGMESEFSNEANIFVNYLRPGVNMLQNGDFSFGEEYWDFKLTDANAMIDASNDDMRILITSPGPDYDCIQLVQDDIALMQGKSYRLEFDAYATENRIMEAFLQQPVYPWNNYGKINPTPLRRGVQHFSYDFQMEDPADYSVQLVFNCGAMPGDVTIDNVSLMIIDNSTLLTPLPVPWEYADVGEPKYEGVAGIKDGKYIVIGGGDDIFGSSDECHYAFQEMQGDVEFSARISSIARTDAWAKAGLMIRGTLHDGSVNAMMGASASNGVFFQRRSVENQSTYRKTGSEIDAPCWLKIVKKDNVFSGYASRDGSEWMRIGSESIQIDDVFYVGFAVTSHNDDVLCTVAFDDVKVKTLLHTENEDTAEPTEFALYAAYPNPFNPTTTISCSVPERSVLKVNVYNLRGKLVDELIDGVVSKGTHEYEFDASDLSSGVYLYDIDAETISGSTFHDVRKMMLVK